MNKHRKRISGRVLGSRLTATLSISLVLLLFGIMMVLGIFANDISKAAKEKISLTLVLKESISNKALKALQKELDTAGWMSSYEYIDEEKALQELSEELGENPEDLLGYNPLPATFEVRLAPAYADIEHIKHIEQMLQQKEGVKEVVYREDLIQLVNKNILSIGKILLGTALILTLISFLLIRNTVRLMIYAKRFLIHTMCLVGAKRSFIRRPFLLENAQCGIWGAILAIGFLYLCMMSLNKAIPGIGILLSTQHYSFIFISLVLLGIGITVSATVFSVNRFLRMQGDDMYYI